MRRRVLAAFAALALGVVAGRARRSRSEPPPPPISTVVPYQFVARVATEGLGRAPSQATWESARAFFGEHGCGAASLAQWARDTFTGDAYAGRGYDAQERTLTLYQAVLARDPDPDGLAASGGDWGDRLDRVFDS